MKMTVIGAFEGTNTNQTAHLTEHRPQGIDLVILHLVIQPDVTVSTSGLGNDVQWRGVVTFK